MQIDPVKRKAIYDKISEIIWNDVPILPFGTYALPGIFNGATVTGICDASRRPARTSPSPSPGRADDRHFVHRRRCYAFLPPPKQTKGRP